MDGEGMLLTCWQKGKGAVYIHLAVHMRERSKVSGQRRRVEGDRSNVGIVPNWAGSVT
jgi:hypothetical protein